MSIDWVEYGDRGLIVNRQTAPPDDELQQLIAGIDHETDNLPFYRADAALLVLLWGDEEYLASLIDDDKGTAKTWQNSLWVGRAIPPDNISVDSGGMPYWSPGSKTRRRIELPFAHHERVARLQPAQQTIYLQLAIDEGLSARALGTRIKEDLGEIVEPTVSDQLRRLRNQILSVGETLPDIMVTGPLERASVLLTNATTDIERAYEIAAAYERNPDAHIPSMMGNNPADAADWIDEIEDPYG